MTDSSGSSTFVLVHGAWGGSYGFRQVRPLLAARGSQVFTPSLTGIGERSHLVHPGIALTTHIHDVVNTVLYEDLNDIVLLGFSYGGMVVTGALEHIGDRVSHLVYLDAFVPNDGERVTDIRGSGTARRRSIELGQDWLIPPLPRQLDDPDAMEWSDARRCGQPVGTFTEPVHLIRPLEDWPFTRTYIKATADPGEETDSAFWRSARHAEGSTAWGYHEIATNHLIPMTHPEELTDILLGITQQS
jgi:pimeloyl-ACP methyl ester carboxylesterase